MGLDFATHTQSKTLGVVRHTYDGNYARFSLCEKAPLITADK